VVQSNRLHRITPCAADWGRSRPDYAAALIARANSVLIVLIRCLVSRVASRSMTDIVIVKVKPGSRKGPLVEIGSNGELTIYVREPAVDGKANDAVARLLAAHLQLPRSRVELVSGATSRQKRFRVSR